MIHKSKAPLGATLVVVSSVFYASYGIWTTLMGNFFGGYTASALRSGVALLILVPIALAYRKFEPLSFKNNRLNIAGLLFTALFIWGPLYYAILQAGIGISLTINYASLVIGMFFFGWLFMKESFTRAKLLSAMLGFVGLGLIFFPSITSIGLLALSAAFISGFATAANLVIVKRMTCNATQSTVLLWVTSVIANFVMALVFQETLPVVGWYSQWLYLVIFGIASVMASWLFVTGLKLIDAGSAGILGLLEIVFGVLFGVVLFHERPTMIVLFGVVVIIIAAAIPYSRDLNIRRRVPYKTQDLCNIAAGTLYCKLKCTRL